jgi:tetratricopeptide (TPR) repeat protein
MNVQEFWQETRAKYSNYYSENTKKVNYIAIGVLAIIGLSTYWTLVYQPSQEKTASEKIARLHFYFKNDSMNIVIKGDKSLKITSAPKIADDYSSTRAGKEAALMAGIAYAKTGKPKEAIEYLNKTSIKDKLLSAQVMAMKAGCMSDLGDDDDAASMYEKAAAVDDNDFSATFLKKAGIHYEMCKDYKSALKCYDTILKKYSATSEGSDIEKYIYKVKALMGEFNP